MRQTLRFVVLMASLVTAALFLISAVRTLQGAHPADASESAVLEQAVRIGRHESPYAPAEATRANTPAVPAAVPGSMPGLSYLVALVAGGDPPKLWIQRALSLTATVFVALLVMVIVVIEAESWTLAVCAASFALFAQGLFGSLPGVSRPDSLALLLSLLGFAALRYMYGMLGAILAAVALAAAFFVDQRTAWFIVAVGVWLAVSDGERLLAFLITTAVLVGGGYVALSGLLGPWFNFESFNAPIAALQFRPGRALRFTADFLLGSFAVCTLVAVLSFAMATQPWHGRRGLWLCFGAAAILAGFVSTQSARFEPGALIASTVALSLIGPLSLQRVARHLSATLDPDARSGERVILVALMLQFVVFFSIAREAGWLQEVFRAGLLGA
ncbi:MAG: hypothetical protein ACREOU_05205 [Candidatus Eiseniibacteriota bacterium]